MNVFCLTLCYFFRYINNFTHLFFISLFCLFLPIYTIKYYLFSHFCIFPYDFFLLISLCLSNLFPVLCLLLFFSLTICAYALTASSWHASIASFVLFSFSSISSYCFIMVLALTTDSFCCFISFILLSCSAKFTPVSVFF